MGTINMSKYKIRTDLAIESINNLEDKINVDTKQVDNIKITKLEVREEYEKKINKKKGNYITIEFDDVTDYNNRQKLISVFSNELKDLLQMVGVNDKKNVLVVGLGNEKSTPDALGPNTIDNILVTRHLFSFEDNNIQEGFNCVSAFNPGVMGVTGIETSDIIKSLVKSIKPDFLIVVDALAASAISRINKTIQITDSGIHPGSGVGNTRKEISKDTINIPVIAIGIPTVVDAVTIVSDTINYMEKHFSYVMKNINSPANKLSFGQSNYIKTDIPELKDEDRRKYMGFLGELNDEEMKELIYEVLSPINYNLMVTPKEVDFLIYKLSEVLSTGINSVLHKNFKTNWI